MFKYKENIYDSIINISNMRDSDSLILENLYENIISNSNDLLYVINHKGEDILVEWEDFKNNPSLNMIRIYDNKEKKQMGAINFRKNYNNGINLGTVIVLKPYRNKGYSQLLMGIVLKYAKENNLNHIYCDFVTPIMMNSFKKMFSNIKAKKDPAKKEHFKDVIIKI